MNQQYMNQPSGGGMPSYPPNMNKNNSQYIQQQQQPHMQQAPTAGMNPSYQQSRGGQLNNNNDNTYIFPSNQPPKQSFPSSQSLNSRQQGNNFNHNQAPPSTTQLGPDINNKTATATPSGSNNNLHSNQGGFSNNGSTSQLNSNQVGTAPGFNKGNGSNDSQQQLQPKIGGLSLQNSPNNQNISNRVRPNIPKGGSVYGGLNQNQPQQQQQQPQNHLSTNNSSSSVSLNQQPSTNYAYLPPSSNFSSNNNSSVNNMHIHSQPNVTSSLSQLTPPSNSGSIDNNNSNFQGSHIHHRPKTSDIGWNDPPTTLLAELSQKESVNGSTKSLNSKSRRREMRRVEHPAYSLSGNQSSSMCNLNNNNAVVGGGRMNSMNVNLAGGQSMCAPSPLGSNNMGVGGGVDNMSSNGSMLNQQQGMMTPNQTPMMPQNNSHQMGIGVNNGMMNTNQYMQQPQQNPQHPTMNNGYGQQGNNGQHNYNNYESEGEAGWYRKAKSWIGLQ